MKEHFIDLTLPSAHPGRAGVRDADPELEARVSAACAVMVQQEAERSIETAKRAAAKQAAHEVIKAKAATDPAFAALVTVLGIQ